MAEPFRLARVLRLAEQMRRLRTHEAERLAAELVAARAEVVRLRGERERLGEIEGADARAGRLTPDALQVGRAYDRALAAAETVRANAVVRLGQALDAKRAEVLHARQEEEKYTRLAAAHRQRVFEEEARESERTLDEIAVDRHRRNRKEQIHDDA
jgi:flagellar export protein FliJ